MKKRRTFAYILAVVGSVLAGHGYAGETAAYKYDARGNLIGVVKNGGPNDGLQSQYCLDREANRTRYTSGVTATAACPALAARPAPPVVPDAKGGFGPDFVLEPGHFILSSDSRFKLIMQLDGNLVLYFGSDDLWSSDTFYGAGAFAILQSDGNFVVYAPGGSPLWSSGTARSNSLLKLQNDGNLVIYGPDGVVGWASNTDGH